MASPVLKPMITDLDFIPDLTVVLTFPRNVMVIGQSGIFWSAPVKYSITGPCPFPHQGMKR